MAYSRQMTRLPNHGFNFNKPPTMPHPFELDIINLSDQERANLVHQNIIPVDVYARGLRETTFELSLKEMPLNLLYAFSSKARREIPPESAIANYQAQQVTIWRVDKIAKTHIRELLLFAYNTCKHTAQGGTASILTRYFTCSGYMLLFKAAESLEMPLAQRWLQRSLQEDLPTMACDDLAACELYASELGMPYITTQFHPVSYPSLSSFVHFDMVSIG